MLGNHLLGLYEKALPAELSWTERLNMAKRLGFDFVEICIDETDMRLARLFRNESTLAEISSAITETGVPIQSMCLSGHRRFPFGSSDSSIRQRANDIMQQAVLFAHALGIRVIQLAGYDVYYEPSTPESRERFLAGLRSAVKLAQTYQVMLAMEIMDTELINSITRYRAYKDTIPSAWFNVYPDLGNLSAWGNDVLRELDIGGNDIVECHIKDTLMVRPGFAGVFKCVPFGSGCVDFPAVFGRLERNGFVGPYVLEMWHQAGQDAEAEVAAALAFVREQYERGASDAVLCRT